MRGQRWWAIVLLVTVSGALAGCSCGDGPLPMLDAGRDGAQPSIDGDVPASCGDGVRDRMSEVCDDGNVVDGDGCSADCLSDESCGNGLIDAAAGEQCDDGNTADSDACRSDCASDYSCGNGVVDTSAEGAPSDEVCDDGNTVNGDGCSAGCDSDESCGNGTVDLGAGEVCDDGNTADGDDCSADCRTSLLCGNGALDGVEECDDGNVDDGDGCNASCQIERCGDGRLDPGEACDDGNTDDADGCTSSCGFTCSADADCEDADVCNGAETCSDPGTASSACNAAASPAADGTACGAGQICLSAACVTSACGDGFADPATEQCDDGNTADADGCDNDCTFTCSADLDCSDSNACTGTETCADPGTASSACVAGTPLADGASCGAGLVCRGGVCAMAGCGDGVVTSPEQCDDGNTVNGDGCDSDCSWTCTGASDCDDANACNGAETCAAPSSLGSRCVAGTPPADGTSCGAGRICVTGACVMARCGDSIVTAPEDCDDGNMANGDGCDTDCTWTCASAADCSDANACNGTESCTSPSTLASRCAAGTPPATGTLCDRDMDPATRDICNMASGTCVASICGDGFVDAGRTPPEQCDDGNSTSGDGCSATCQTEMATPPTGFRVTSLRLISPRVVVDVSGCQDITDNCIRAGFLGCVEDGVNTQLATAINPTSMGGDYSLHLVNLFRPLNPSAATTPTELHLNAACMEAPTPDSCGPDMMPDVIASIANNQGAGTCYAPVAAEVNTRAGMPAMYTPTVNTVSGPCFVSDETSLVVTLSGISIPLERARVAATYSGTPPNRLISGVVTGFLTDQAAADVLLPDTLPLVGGDPLYSHLQAGNRTTMNSMGMTVVDGCNLGGGAHEDDGDMNGATRGFWFFLNFTAELITWTGP